MTKRLLVLICVFMMFCVGCTDGVSDKNANVGEETNKVNTERSTTEDDSEGESIEDSENVGDTEADIPQEGLVYDELSHDTLVSDETMNQKVLQLVLDEKELIDTIEVDCEVDTEDTYEIDGMPYFRVVEADSWSYYVDSAKAYYSETALDRFTTRYTEESKLFVETDGKLYRAAADGIKESIYEDSIEIWQAEDNMYYVTIRVNTVGGGDYYNGYVIQASENNSYGYEIMDRVIVY